VSYEHPIEKRPLRVALVLWSGHIGGAQRFSVELARSMQSSGAAPSVVFVLDGTPLTEHLDALAIPHSALGLLRGRSVLRTPRRLAEAVSATAADAAILVASGYLAAALRIGGYRAPVIGVEHGSLLQLRAHKPLKRLVRHVDRASGVMACSAVVAVSRYMMDRVNDHRPRPRVVCIPNGVDLQRFSPPIFEPESPRTGELVAGCAARLVAGKGVEDAIHALTHASLQETRLRIAGSGPLRNELEELARSLAVDSRTEFLGEVLDMPAFWRSVDVAVVPSSSLVESFGMVAVEAMACARPVVATQSGALPSVVEDRVTGRIVPPGDVEALASAIAEYADAGVRARHGAQGRRRCEEKYSIERTARQYLELCGELVREAAAN
jgi:glycosyltransferase involved in cell wall biosynthesis